MSRKKMASDASAKKVREVKPDLWKNTRQDKLGIAMERQREKESNLVPLRIDHKTVIQVTPDKCNEEFRQEWIRKKKYSETNNW